MSGNHQSLAIGVLAVAAGVNVETIRYYQRRGLMSAPGRSRGGIRRYGAGDLARLSFIKSAQRLGFTLDEVASLLRLEDGEHCEEAREHAQRKLDDVRAKLTDLRHIEGALAGMITRCRKAAGTVRCPLITALQENQA